MARCYSCGKDGFQLHKTIDRKEKKGYRWELYDPNSESYHNVEKCKKEHHISTEKLGAKVYYGKLIEKNKMYNYPDKPKPAPLVGYLCSCNENDCFPALSIDPKYYFNTWQIYKTVYTYWCSNCGNELSSQQIEEYFNSPDFDKLDKLMYEK